MILGKMEEFCLRICGEKGFYALVFRKDHWAGAAALLGGVLEDFLHPGVIEAEVVLAAGAEEECELRYAHFVEDRQDFFDAFGVDLAPANVEGVCGMDRERCLIDQSQLRGFFVEGIDGVGVEDVIA